jgi:RNA-binding protein 26
MWLPDAPGFNPMMGFMPMMMPFPNVPFPYMDGGAYDPNQAQMDMGATRPDEVNGSVNADSKEAGLIQSGPEIPENFDGINNAVPRNGRGLSHRGGRSRPGFTSRPTSSDEKTLVVEKIPVEKLSLESINDWFKKFGEVTNVAINTKGSKALISFQNHTEALNAWRSQDAVFGNRFVKVYWHRPMEGRGTAGKRALEASAAKLEGTEQRTPQPEASDTSVKELKPSQSIKSALSLDARTALEKNMAEQKVLFSRLKTAEGDLKKGILARIRVLSDGMGDPLSVPESTLVFEEKVKASTHNSETPARFEKLDKELDLRQAVQDLTKRAQDPNEDHDAIRIELEELTAKVYFNISGSA